eukprot:6173040-Pleurochrysis_carterae.AAC.2
MGTGRGRARGRWRKRGRERAAEEEGWGEDDREGTRASERDRGGREREKEREQGREKGREWKGWKGGGRKESEFASLLKATGRSQAQQRTSERAQQRTSERAQQRTSERPARGLAEAPVGARSICEKRASIPRAPRASRSSAAAADALRVLPTRAHCRGPRRVGVAAGARPLVHACCTAESNDGARLRHKADRAALS